MAQLLDRRVCGDLGLPLVVAHAEGVHLVRRREADALPRAKVRLTKAEAKERLLRGEGVGVHAERGERLFERLIAWVVACASGEVVCTHAEDCGAFEQQQVEAVHQLREARRRG